MNTAIFDTPSLFAPLQGLLRWLLPATPSARTVTPAYACAYSTGYAVARPASLPASSVLRNNRFKLQSPRTRAAKPVRKPLRIVRLVEADNAPAHVGRMVMSGRMADVCAELDRMTACESTRH